MRLIILTVILLSQHSPPKFHQLEGTWQVDGKNQFEVWHKSTNGVLIGKGYKIKKQDTLVLETLQIKQVNDQITYTATVPDQNEARPINFILNQNLKDTLSFENPNHDFPQKIQYVFLTDSTLFVRVLGVNDKGFSFGMVKQ